ncbi:hypothetical protein QFC21_001004 [Naganishia friedmannii]|uniref:Uncharacterized protein n=1 Tax=Naganishia friedmannii TaxID=89922 RepID=A0ACC2W9M2_9TREE|nr:hypothetical protein QFC21_001004 [Naganishia friedmannii]
MSLALEPDNIDRYGDQGGGDYDYDDHAVGGHLPFIRVGTVSNTALDGNSTLAGVDDTTALKWKYEDKMVTMGLVFGSMFRVVYSLTRKIAVSCEDESGSATKDTRMTQMQRFPGAYAQPPPLYYGNQPLRDISNENTARTNATILNHRPHFPAAGPTRPTVPSQASSEDISTSSSFDRFMTAPTPPPFAQVPSKTPLRDKATAHDSALPAYVLEYEAVKGEKSQVTQSTSPQLDAPAPAFLQPVGPGTENQSVTVRAPQDSTAPTLNLRVPFDQWRFGM